MKILSVRWVVSALTAFVTPLVLHAQVKVLMNRYGGQRTGANLTSSSAGAIKVHGHQCRLHWDQHRGHGRSGGGA